MTLLEPRIDPYRFRRLFDDFQAFVEGQSDTRFVSFASSSYTEDQEGYKYRIYNAGRQALDFRTWKRSAIGDGRIARAVIGAIEIPESNLVQWQARFGPKSRPHRALYEAELHPYGLPLIERALFELYRGDQDEQTFGDLTKIFGRTYPLIAYLFFLKDRTRYLPIAPTYFDDAFEYLGADFKTSGRCSWENYLAYLALMGELKAMLAESIGGEVSLLDAHSFAWMLVAQMKKADALANIEEYTSLSGREREAIALARVGQGEFRRRLIEYWGACAITGCGELMLLRASHIKPWASSSPRERMDPYNGLLLSPDIDACFDAGLIAFDDEGLILISSLLHPSDAEAIAIRPDMRLRRVEQEHNRYLAFQRDHVFKS
jgi:hypothetical protein